MRLVFLRLIRDHLHAVLPVLQACRKRFGHSLSLSAENWTCLIKTNPHVYRRHAIVHVQLANLIRQLPRNLTRHPSRHTLLPHPHPDPFSPLFRTRRQRPPKPTQQRQNYMKIACVMTNIFVSFHCLSGKTGFLHCFFGVNTRAPQSAASAELPQAPSGSWPPYPPRPSSRDRHKCDGTCAPLLASETLKLARLNVSH